jgi:hypothetical protein
LQQNSEAFCPGNPLYLGQFADQVMPRPINIALPGGAQPTTGNADKADYPPAAARS